MKKSAPRRSRPRTLADKNRKCVFCTDKKEPTYEDVEMLKRFVTERGKIVGRMRNGNCALHQRRLTIAIKHARHLALLPFVGQR